MARDRAAVCELLRREMPMFPKEAPMPLVITLFSDGSLGQRLDTRMRNLQAEPWAYCTQDPAGVTE